MVFAAVATAANKKFTLVIDAGHGGTDAGAVGKITKEKKINLDVALVFGRLVERNCPDVRVIYTRKTDVFVPLHKRADIANRAKADLFISIHTNALPRGRISRGLETYTLGMHRAADNLDVAKRENSVILIETDYKQRYQGFDPRSSESYIMFEFMQDRNMAQSVELAKCVQRRACASSGRQNKGVKQAGFLVLRETSMPSCLIELGFISTPDEERFLDSSNGVERLGRGIYQAFLDYRGKYDKNIRVPFKAEPEPEVKIPTVVPEQEVKEEKPTKQKKQPNKPSEPIAPVANTAESPEAPVPTPIAEAPAATNTAAPTSAEVPAAPAANVAQATVASAAPVAQTAPAAQAAPAKVAQAAPAKVASSATPAKAASSAAPAASATPIFKVQFLASSSKLKANDSRLKGVTDSSFFQEGGLYKYTVGASENYNEINQLRKSLADKFPQAFIIAFKNGQKMDVREAIREFKNRK